MHGAKVTKKFTSDPPPQPRKVPGGGENKAFAFKTSSKDRSKGNSEEPTTFTMHNVHSPSSSSIFGQSILLPLTTDSMNLLRQRMHESNHKMVNLLTQQIGTVYYCEEAIKRFCDFSLLGFHSSPLVRVCFVD